MVPNVNKSTALINKVAQIIDLELESPDDSIANIAVSDIETYLIDERLTLLLAKTDGEDDHYAVLFLSLSLNKTHKDYVELSPLISQYENNMKEIVSDEFAKYTIDEARAIKDKIREQVTIRIQELFQSDFVINVSFGNILFD
jgi:flagellar FliL protein